MATEYSSAQVAMRNVSNPAVFTRNFSDRLEDAVRTPRVTHRAQKPWRSAEVGVEHHGSLPAYIKSRDEDGDLVTHVGTIETVIVNPQEADESVVDRLRKNVADRDSWSEYFDGATTMYLLTECRELEEKFPFTELKKIVDGEPLPSSYSRQPAYVYARDN